MKRLIALVVSGIALAACASPTEPASTVSPRMKERGRVLASASSAPSEQVNLRIASN